MEGLIYYNDVSKEYAFRYACENGYLEAAQWLLYIEPNIDVSAKNEVAFRYACENGHLEVAQWLLFVKPDIDVSANYEYAFRNASLNDHLHILQWLYSVKPTIIQNRNICCSGFWNMLTYEVQEFIKALE